VLRGAIYTAGYVGLLVQGSSPGSTDKAKGWGVWAAGDSGCPVAPDHAPGFRPLAASHCGNGNPYIPFVQKGEGILP
jgi:hypothetical protein